MNEKQVDSVAGFVFGTLAFLMAMVVGGFFLFLAAAILWSVK